jgi:D-3-phosphoglycerate dehydrogenase
MVRMTSTSGFHPRPRHRALVTAPMRGPGLDLLRQLADVVLDPWVDQRPLRLYDADALAARIDAEGADIVVVEADRVAGAVLERPLVAVATTRGDPTNVDVPAATAAGVPVLRAPGRNADGVAELTVGLLLAATRGIVAADADVRQCQVFGDGTIPYQRFRSWELAGRTAGLVGLGAVGRAVRWRLQGLGMQVIAADPYAADATCDLEHLLARADVVSMHAPVTPETLHMMGAEQFAAMRQDAVYLNTARAQLHDTDALVDALTRGHLAACALDHLEGEQLPAGHPLLSLPNVVLTPHIGGATYDTETRHSTIVATGLCQLLAGAVPGCCVNPEVLTRPTR